MGPRDRLRKVSRNYFSLLLLPSYYFPTGAPTVTYVLWPLPYQTAPSAYNLLKPLMPTPTPPPSCEPLSLSLRDGTQSGTVAYSFYLFIFLPIAVSIE